MIKKVKHHLKKVKHHLKKVKHIHVFGILIVALVVVGLSVIYNKVFSDYSDGTPDPSFLVGQGFNNSVKKIAVQDDGKIIVVGPFTMYKGSLHRGIIRLHPNGDIDSSFNGNFYSSTINDVKILNDGKILVGGSFLNYNGEPLEDKCIIRLHSNGDRDTSFNVPGVFGSNFGEASVNAIELNNNGKIIVGGVFTTLNNISHNRIVRLESNGNIDDNFNTGTGFDDTVSDIEIDTNDKIYVGGFFNHYYGTSNSYIRNNIVRLNSDGTIDDLFNIGTGFNDGVKNIKITNDKIYVGGYFTTYNSYTYNRIIRLNSDGTRDTNFGVFGPNGAFNSYVSSIDVQNDSKIIVVGAFGTYKGIPQQRIVRLNSDGSKDTSFNIGESFNPEPETVLIIDQKILVGGSFTTYQDISYNKITRLGCCAIPNTPTVTLSASPTSISENGGTSTITATISITQNIPTTVVLNYTGTATHGTDYSGPTLITIPANSTNGTTTISSTNDTEDESDETIIATIYSVPTGMVIGNPNTATITILDDDNAPSPPPDPLAYWIKHNETDPNYTLSPFKNISSPIYINDLPQIKEGSLIVSGLKVKGSTNFNLGSQYSLKINLEGAGFGVDGGGGGNKYLLCCKDDTEYPLLTNLAYWGTITPPSGDIFGGWKDEENNRIALSNSSYNLQLGKHSVLKKDYPIFRTSLNDNQIGNTFGGLFAGGEGSSNEGYYSYNTGVGYKALNISGGSPSFNNNSALGYKSSSNISLAGSTGINNTSLGSLSLYFTNTGDNNTAVGHSALYNNTYQDNNTAVGYNAGPSSSLLDNTTAIGANATVIYPDTMVFGDSSVLGWGFGTSPGTYAIKVNGSNGGNDARLTKGGNWESPSDRTLKHDIVDLSYGLNEIMKLRPVDFRWNDNNEKDIGFIAQEVKEILPEIVAGKDGDMTMSYDQIGVVLTKAISEQQEQLDNDKIELENFEKKINDLENKN